MNKILHPAHALMARLSYARKFLLVSAVFVVPLMFLAVQAFSHDYQQLQRTSLLQDNVQRLRDMTTFIQQLELLRDLIPLRIVSNDDSVVADRYAQARQVALKHLSNLGYEHDDGRVLAASMRERLGLEVPSSPGSEAFRVDQNFENAQQLVKDAYDWRYLAASRAGLFALEHRELDQLAALLTSLLPRLTEHAGTARAYGAYFLHRQYIDSASVRLLERVWQDLDSDASQLELLAHEQQALTTEVLIGLRDSLVEIRDDFDEHLIQTLELTADWEMYFDRVTQEVGIINQVTQRVFHALEDRLAEDYARQRAALVTYSAFLVLVLLLAMYLFLGFYSSVRHTVMQLRDAASRVARGSYETPVHVSSSDELSELALSLDDMRMELKRREGALRDFGLRDGLTGLQNRICFDQALSEALNTTREHATWISLILLDLDYFKSVNDIHGHVVGDGVLKHVADIFRTIFRQKQDVISRYGGEEFAIILIDMPPQLVKDRTEQLRQKIESTPFMNNEMPINITASIGVVCFAPGSSIEPEELIRATDSALYRAKDAGRNRVVFEEIG